jgi:hypothetical protein
MTTKSIHGPIGVGKHPNADLVVKMLARHATSAHPAGARLVAAVSEDDPTVMVLPDGNSHHRAGISAPALVALAGSKRRARSDSTDSHHQ